MTSNDKTPPNVKSRTYGTTSPSVDETDPDTDYYSIGSSKKKIISPIVFGAVDLVYGAGLCVGAYFLSTESLYNAITIGGFGVLAAFFGILALFSTLILAATFLVRIWRRLAVFLSFIVLSVLVLLQFSGFFLPLAFLCESAQQHCTLIRYVVAAGIGALLFVYSICSFIVTRTALSRVSHRLSRHKAAHAEIGAVDLDTIAIEDGLVDDPLASPGPIPDNGPEAVEAKKIRSAISKFNAKPSQGVAYLAECGLSDGTAAGAAVFIRNTGNLHLDKIGDYLGDWPEFNKQVLQEYTMFFDFSGMTLDNALRAFLSKFRLPGEAQKIDRVMERFARRYHQCNINGDFSSDTAYILAFSLIMLNTDAHSPHIKRKMTKQEFLSNNRGIAGGRDLSPELLGDLYDRIVREEIKLHADLMFAATVKKGYLRKRGRNGNFQKRYFVLSNNCLFYFKNVDDQDPRAMIPLEGLQLVKIDDTKTDGPQNAFGLCLSDPLSDRVKSCKFVAGKAPTPTDHAAYRLYAETEEERDEWNNILQLHIVGHPFHTLIKNKKQNWGRRHTVFQPSSLQSTSVVMPQGMLPAMQQSTSSTSIVSMQSNGSGGGGSSSGGPASNPNGGAVAAPILQVPDSPSTP